MLREVSAKIQQKIQVRAKVLDQGLLTAKVAAVSGLKAEIEIKG